MCVMEPAVDGFCVSQRGFHDRIQDLPLVVVEYRSERIRGLAEVPVQNAKHLRKIRTIERIDELVLEGVVILLTLVCADARVHQVISHVECPKTEEVGFPRDL